MMRSAEALWDDLLELGETNRIEAKLATAIDRSTMETVCAFANEPGLGGGYLLFGVAREGHDAQQPYRVHGVDRAEELQADLATQCAAVFNRAVRVLITVERLEGRPVIVVCVPEAAATDKPVYLRNLGLPRGAFRRIAATDQHGTEDDLIALYAGHHADRFDRTVLPDVGWDDLDPAAIAEYRQRRREVNPVAPELAWSDAELLQALECAVVQQGQVRPTVAGLLLFGTHYALRRRFPMIRIDYIRVSGRRWVEDPDHRFDTLEIRAPLLEAIRRATNAVRDELLQSFSLPEGAIMRNDTLTLPIRVVREAIVNAVMHRSYRQHGPMQIIRYANRLEIRNPGYSLKPVEALGEPGSMPRNPVLASVLHDVSAAETKGSGIRVMRDLMQAQNLLPPTFESQSTSDQFVATFLFHHFLAEEDIVWLGRLTDAALSDEDARALVYLREVGAIDNATYRDLNRTDTLNASVRLRRLRDLALLEMKGSGSRTYYVPGAAFVASFRPVSGDSHQSGGDQHVRIPADPLFIQSDPRTDASNPVSMSSDSHHLLVTISEDSHHLPEDMPTALRARIPPLRSKPRREVMSSLIVDLCRWRPLSARDVALILRRNNQKVLVRDYLTPMVAAGLLAYTIPTQEHHPEQRYVAVNAGAAPTADEGSHG